MSRDASFEDGAEQALGLIALDADDLRIVSGLVQDAVLSSADIRWIKSERRFALLLNRFRWEDANDGRRDQRPFERVRSVLVINEVMSVQSQGLPPKSDEMVLSILALNFAPGEDGTGHLHVVFAGDGEIRVAVEALDVVLRDVTRPYVAPSSKKPDHSV